MTPLPVRAVALAVIVALAGACAAPARTDPSSEPAATSGPAGTHGPSGTPGPTGSPGPTGISHVVVVWMENTDALSITPSSMPYLYGLSQTYGRADQYYAIGTPSQPNYLAFWSGSTQGVTDDGVHDLSGPTLSGQMTDAGLSWRIYAQDYPAGAGCYTGETYDGGVDGPGQAGTYARKHNPAISFTSISGSGECANIQPLAQFDPGVNLAFVVPNLCNDMHDCSPATGDAFLSAFLPQVLDSPDWAHTLLVVTFDEGTTGANGGGQVFAMVARDGLSGFTSSTQHDHYGLLRTVEDVFGLPCLGSACSAQPLSEFLPDGPS